MDINNINLLLNKYWEGQTSLSEEAWLKDYFNSPEVDETLKPYQPLFKYFKQEENIGLDERFERNLTAKLKGVKPQTAITRNLSLWLIRAAAVILILFAGYQSWQQYHSNQKTLATVETYETPEEAYQKTKELLLLVSTKIKKGTNQATAGVVRASKATQKINQVRSN